MSNSQTQAAAELGGLQNHSIGDFYPLIVVGYGRGEEVIYTVENIQRGTVACAPGRTGMTIRQWVHAKWAEQYLSEAARGHQDPAWQAVRPVYSDDPEYAEFGYLVPKA